MSKRKPFSFYVADVLLQIIQCAKVCMYNIERNIILEFVSPLSLEGESADTQQMWRDWFSVPLSYNESNRFSTLFRVLIEIEFILLPRIDFWMSNITIVIENRKWRGIRIVLIHYSLYKGRWLDCIKLVTWNWEQKLCCWELIRERLLIALWDAEPKIAKRTNWI